MSDYRLYVTFGQVHRHHVQGIDFNKDTIAEIHGKDWNDCRRKAFELFGNKFATTHEDISHFRPEWMTGGVHRVDVEDETP